MNPERNNEQGKDQSAWQQQQADANAAQPGGLRDPENQQPQNAPLEEEAELEQQRKEALTERD